MPVNLWLFDELQIPVTRGTFAAILSISSCKSFGIERFRPPDVEGRSSMLCEFLQCCFKYHSMVILYIVFHFFIFILVFLLFFYCHFFLKKIKAKYNYSFVSMNGLVWMLLNICRNIYLKGRLMLNGVDSNTLCT